MTTSQILREYKVIAVAGLSSNALRPSFGVSQYMQKHGYRIIPVNPQETSVLGEKCYPTLLDVPEKVEIVNVFRRAEFVPELVEQAIQIGAKCVWMQEGVVHDAAAAKARAAGLEVVMDRCLLKEHARL
jgi:uncharacterized protein